MFDPAYVRAVFTPLETIYAIFERRLPEVSTSLLVSIVLHNPRWAVRAWELLCQRAAGDTPRPVRDEDLLPIIRDGEPHWAKRAKDFLHAGHAERLRRFVAARLRPFHLTREDAEDAQQNTYFAFEDALGDFDPQKAAAEDCTFGTFLYGVVYRRLHDFLRSRGCVEKHYNRQVRLDDAHGEEAAALCKLHFRPGGQAVRDGPVTDPALLVVEQEERERLAAAVATLDELDRALWDLLAGGMHLPEAAQVLGLHYRKAARQRCRLFERLRMQLATAAG